MARGMPENTQAIRSKREWQDNQAGHPNVLPAVRVRNQTLLIFGAVVLQNKSMALKTNECVRIRSTSPENKVILLSPDPKDKEEVLN